MATKAIKPKSANKTEETYVSGEEYQALHQHEASPRRVTMAVPSVMTVIVVVLLCALSFYGGLNYQKHHDSSTNTTGRTALAGGNGLGSRGGFGGARRAGGFGQVTAISSTSITVSDQRSGTTKTYTINSTTTISDNGQAAAIGDIQTGDTVIVTTSSSTSTTATRILVNPSFGGDSDMSAPVDPSDSSSDSQTN